MFTTYGVRMNTVDARALLTQLSSSESGEILPSDCFASPPPWVDFYPPTGFLPELAATLRQLDAKAVHYIGLADESILRFLAALPLRVSVMDMLNWWGVEEGNTDSGTLFSTKNRVPKELAQIRFFIEGSPTLNDVVIVDVRTPRGLITDMQFFKRLNAEKHCIALLGPALKILRHLPDYDWSDGEGFSLGVFSNS